MTRVGLSPNPWAACLSIASTVLLVVVAVGRSGAQLASPPDDYRYRAHWITHPDAEPQGFGVYQFTLEVDVPERPGQVWARISGDNRYEFYINNNIISHGPQPGDVQHWRYHRVDIGPYLKPGRNVLTAKVWNYGPQRPVAMMSFATGFLLEIEGEDPLGLSTGKTWQAQRDLRYGIHTNSAFAKSTYVVVAPGEVVDMRKGFDDAVSAKVLVQAENYGHGTDGGHKLTWDGMGELNIPVLTEVSIPEDWHNGYGTPKEPLTVDHALHSWMLNHKSTVLVRVDGEERVTDEGPLVIPPRTRRRLLYAAPVLTNGSLRSLHLANAAGLEVIVTYAEALVDANGVKGHRDSLTGKHVFGIQDSFVCGDNVHCGVDPLNWRTWRYIELDLTTGDSAVTVDGTLLHFETHYYQPFESQVASTSDPRVADIHRVGLNTADACLAETFMDCPYYERLQYLGDTRIQALIRLYASTDDRPILRAIRDFDQSRLPEGITQSRYPSWRTQVIPPFSLFWIGMIGDYYRIRGDTAIVRETLPGMRQVLDWHEARLRPDGLLGALPWWNFVDWAEEWPWDEAARQGGVPPQGQDGGSVLLTLQYAYALRQAAELLSDIDASAAEDYSARHQRVLTAVAKTYDPTRDLYPDAKDLDSYSQHTQIMAVLAGLYDGDRQAGQRLLSRTLSDTALIQTTYYYRFYLFEAMARMGMADQYLAQLGPWQEMLDLGLTTFAEKPEPTRSDCHAWSASPSYHLFRLVGGIDIHGGGRTIDCAPQLGSLKDLTLVVPHPGGDISADYKVSDSGGLTATIVLPEGTSGTLIWRGKRKSLSPGTQTIAVE